MEIVRAGGAGTVSAAIKLISQNAADSVEQDKQVEPPTSVGENIILYHSTVAGLGRQIVRGSVDVMIFMPPRDAPLEVYPKIAALAGIALKDDGVLVVGADVERLPQLLGRLKSRTLQWVTLAYLMFADAVVTSEEPHWLSTRCLPLLVLGKPGYQLGGGEVVIDVPRTHDGGRHWLPVLGAGKECVVNRFARWGKVVCDAMLSGSSGAAVAARDRGCAFIGADDDASRLEQVRKALYSGSGARDDHKAKGEIRQMSFA